MAAETAPLSGSAGSEESWRPVYSPLARVVTLGCAGCAAFFSVAESIALGIALVVVGTLHKSEACEVPISTWAIVQGVMLLLLLPLTCFTLVSAATVALAVDRPQMQATGILATLSGALFLLVALVLRVALLVWGTVLLFSSNRWGRFQSGDYEFCSTALYQPWCVISGSLSQS